MLSLFLSMQPRNASLLSSCALSLLRRRCWLSSFSLCFACILLPFILSTLIIASTFMCLLLPHNSSHPFHLHCSLYQRCDSQCHSLHALSNPLFLCIVPTFPSFLPTAKSTTVFLPTSIFYKQLHWTLCTYGLFKTERRSQIWRTSPPVACVVLWPMPCQLSPAPQKHQIKRQWWLSDNCSLQAKHKREVFSCGLQIVGKT